MSSPALPLDSAGARLALARGAMERIAQQVSSVLQGKQPQTRLAVTCLAARGHLLIEDIPGVGKTTLAEALARSCSLSFARIQFTADLLPSDIVGAQVLVARDSRFEFRPGPLFHQLVLADELNRAPPRTQSALLEAMAQGQATVDGVTHPLPSPFSVVATQNPTDLSGTYPLPDSQLDRFLMRLSLGPPTPEVEAALLQSRGATDPLARLTPVVSADELVQLQRTAADTAVSEDVAQYAVRLVSATRENADIERGASTRAALALMAAAKAHSLWDGRSYVTPGDVRAVWGPVIAHRLLLRSSVHGVFSREEASHLLEEIARRVVAPR